MTAEKLAAVVVTYNRKPLLEMCLEAILAQTRSIDHLVVVDNASTDGTTAWLKSWQQHHSGVVTVCALEENTGGAGGFARGLDVALGAGADWVWMMDDDALPYPDAMEQLIAVCDNPANIYGSLAVNGGNTAWLTTLVGDRDHVVSRADDVPDAARVRTLPFLGFMIHRSRVQAIGLPDAGYFIAADDVEYCMRAARSGSEIIIAGRSRIEHPKSENYTANLGLVKITCLKLSPWKRYYDTRNRLLIAREYYGFRLLTQTVPGSLVRLFAALLYEPERLAQIRAFIAGFCDGLMGRKGRRHEAWGIVV